jgi:hypothetical protein
MEAETVSSTGEREYDLKEAAQILGKTPSALRMQIRRGSILANERPIHPDDPSGPYKLYIPQSEIDKEQRRLDAGTRRAEERRVQSGATEVGGGHDGRTTLAARLPAAGGPTIATLLARQDQMEQELRQEREDTRALIRAVEQQVDMLKTMVTAFMSQK